MMNCNLFTKSAGLIGTVLGSVLAGLPLASTAIATPIAQLPGQQSVPNETITFPGTGTSVQLSQIRVANAPQAPQNPCPGIYYEAPYNQYVVVPQGCRANLITQQLDQMGMLQSIRATGSTNTPGNPNGVVSPYSTPTPAY